MPVDWTTEHYRFVRERNPSARYVVGIDESGCGTLAGPLVVAAVAFPIEMERIEVTWKGVRGDRTLVAGDSKTIKDRAQRALLARTIAAAATSMAVIERTAAEIDARLFGTVFPEAVRLAASRCLEQLVVRDGTVRPDSVVVIVDGDLERPTMPCPVHCIAGADAIDWRVGAASVVAKARHDARMDELHDDYPTWGFDTHRGYPTKGHKELLAKRGPSPVHRRSFRPVMAASPRAKGIEE
jgi:ribonuclease HII